MNLFKCLVFFVCAATMQATLAQSEGLGAPREVVLRNQAYAFQHGSGGVPKNLPRAIELYCEAAKLGDATAQFNLGWVYGNGKGVPRDDALAAYFYTMAAQQGHQQAQFWLRSAGKPSSSVPECLRDPEPVPNPIEEALAAASPQQRKVIELLAKLAPEYGVDPSLGLAILRTESNFDPKAVSPKNAQGLMQLIPETAARFNVAKPFDPEQNIRGGLAYLRWLLAYFKGNIALVAAGYNAGEGAVNRFKGIPPYQETQQYVKRIIGVFKREEHPFDASVTQPSPELHAIRVKM